MNFPARHLTASEQSAELASWATLCATLPHDTGRGGVGLPDPDMVEWCEALNSIPGVCTVQSCAGHVEPGGVLASAHLWLRLDPAMSRAFDADAFRLAARVAHIEQVARVYAPWGKEIASITFAGNERDSLRPSMRLIVAFLRSLAAKVRAGQV